MKTNAEHDMITDDRTGGSGRKTVVNPPVAHFTEQFTPKSAAPRPYELDDIRKRLLEAGFVDADTDQADYLLNHVSYQHASEYFDLFKTDGVIEEGASARELHQTIVFDRKYQALVLEYIGLFELQFRAQFSYHLSMAKGAFAHRDPRNFKDADHYSEFLRRYEDEFNRCLKKRNASITRSYETYGDVPVWRAVEIMSFGTLSMLYNNTKSKSIRNGVAQSFHASTEDLASWARSLSSVRNVCAHFGKLCGERLVSKPRRIPGYNAFDNGHPFYIAILLLHLLRGGTVFADDPSLTYNFQMFAGMSELLTKNAGILHRVGFPEDWRSLVDVPEITGLGIGEIGLFHDEMGRELMRTHVEVKPAGLGDQV